MESWSILQGLISQKGLQKTVVISPAAEFVAFVADTDWVPMLKTDIAALEVGENFVSFEILLPVGEAVLRIALRRRFPNTLIGQVPAMY